jgi:lipoprotein-releasing system permease protein
MTESTPSGNLAAPVRALASPPPVAAKRPVLRPFAAFEWMIALRYLRARRTESFVSVISGFSLVGIALGVATLIIVMSVMNGFRHELLGRILGLQGHVIVQGVGGGLPDFDRIAARVARVPNVTRVAPIVDGQALASGGGSSPGVIIGYRLANRLGLAPGAQITLIAPRGNVTPFGVTPRIKTYTVAGTFNIGMSEYDNAYIFMPLQEAQLYFNMGNTVTGLEVMITDADAVNSLIAPIAEAAGPFARVRSWQVISSSLFQALEIERNVMFLILTLIILVAALNIVSGLIMLVKDKSGDIAILRTMGATRGAVMRVFLIAGASIGVLGTILGFIIGLVFCENIESIRQFLSSLTGTTLFDPEIYFLSHMPAQVDAGEVASVVVMSLALSLLATLYPSWRAARLDPVEALRYE